MVRSAFLLVIFLGAKSQPAAAQIDVTSRSTIFPGPYEAELVDVIDGDTLDLRVAIWPGIIADYAVRVRGVDAPEIRRASCEGERAAGEKARDWIQGIYGPDTRIQLRDVSYDPFSGRVVADVRRWRTDRWLSLAAELTSRDLAQRWTPDMDDVPWALLYCATADPTD